MGCGCKVHKQITYLEKRYGDNLPQSKNTKIGGDIIKSVRSIFVFVIIIPLLPIFATYILITGKGKPLDIRKTFKLAK